MSSGEFAARRDRTVAELKLLHLEVGEMGLDEATTDLVLDRANRLISKAKDCASERELDRVNGDLGRLQAVVHEALHNGAARRASEDAHTDQEI